MIILSSHSPTILVLTVCSEAVARLARVAAKPCLSESRSAPTGIPGCYVWIRLNTYEYSVYLLCIQRRIQKWIQSRVFAQPSGNRRCVSGGISSRILVATVDTGGYIGYTSDTHRIRVSGVFDGYARILPDTGKNTCRIQTQYTWIRSYSITKGTIFDNKRHFSHEPTCN